MKKPLYLLRELARTLLTPPRPNGTKISGPSQHVAAKNAENMDPTPESFSFTCYPSRSAKECKR